MQDVTLVWKGEEFRIEARGILPLIAQIESVVTLGELVLSMQSGKIPVAKLSQAFGLALRYAGARVTDEEVYAGMFAEKKLRAVQAAINVLLSMMIPPEPLRENADTGKKKAAGTRGGSSSKKHTKHV